MNEKDLKELLLSANKQGIITTDSASLIVSLAKEKGYIKKDERQ